MPTPQRPIGFCGDGNSWWPAANPPAEWWDGTPGIAKVRFRGGTGSTSPPFDDGSTQVEMRVLLDRAPKNILWKPGWSLSHSIVVGTKVFVVCAAGWPEGQDCAQLLCYSADTGKELWRRHSGR